MVEKLAVDMKNDASLSELAVALLVLHRKAFATWGERDYTQQIIVADGVFTVELTPEPSVVKR